MGLPSEKGKLMNLENQNEVKDANTMWESHMEIKSTSGTYTPAESTT